MNRATIEDQKKGVPIWNKFPDVFKEISGLTPDRVMKFSINVIRGVAPISKAQYWMTPPELDMLKEQLQEYSDKD